MSKSLRDNNFKRSSSSQQIQHSLINNEK
jgi:hypothetical protein